MDRNIDEAFGDYRIWNWAQHKTKYISDQATLSFLDKYFAIYRRPDGKLEDRLAVMSSLSEGVLPTDMSKLHLPFGRLASSAMLAHLVLLPLDICPVLADVGTLAGGYNRLRNLKRLNLKLLLPAPGEREVSTGKTIRRVVDPKQQQAETYRYWQGLPVGDRLSAVWDVSEAAYSFAAVFKGAPLHDAQRPQRAVTRVQRSRG